MSSACADVRTVSSTSVSIRAEWDVPSIACADAGKSSSSSSPARMASSICVVHVARGPPYPPMPLQRLRFEVPVWQAMPSRTSEVKFKPAPSCSSTSTTRTLCSLWRNRSGTQDRRPEHRGNGRCARAAPPRRHGRTAYVPGHGRARWPPSILIQAQRPSDGAGDLRHFQRMRQARAEVVALRSDEDLRLMGKPPKRFRVQNLVTVALVFAAQHVRFGRMGTALGGVGERSIP